MSSRGQRAYGWWGGMEVLDSRTAYGETVYGWYIYRCYVVRMGSMDDTVYRARVNAVPSMLYSKVGRRGRGDTCSVECRVDLVSWLVRTYY